MFTANQHPKTIIMFSGKINVTLHLKFSNRYIYSVCVCVCVGRRRGVGCIQVLCRYLKYNLPTKRDIITAKAAKFRTSQLKMVLVFRFYYVYVVHEMIIMFMFHLHSTTISHFYKTCEVLTFCSDHCLRYQHHIILCGFADVYGVVKFNYRQKMYVYCYSVRFSSK